MFLQKISVFFVEISVFSVGTNLSNKSSVISYQVITTMHKFRISRYALLWGALAFSQMPSTQVFAQEMTKEQLLTNMIGSNIQYQHYAPKEVNDVYSEQAYNTYLKRLDNTKRYFLQSDVDALAKFKKLLDDQMQTGEFLFFDQAIKTFDKRFVQVTEYYKDILSKPFDFKVDETVETSGEKLSFAKTEADLKDRWRKVLKYQTLTRIQTRLDLQTEAEAKKDTSVKIKTFEEIEKEEREKALKNYDKWAADVMKDSREDRLAFYINSFVAVLEPHSEYYPPAEKTNFDIRMSGKLEGIGASLREEEGFIKVAKIITGSPAWRQGELKENDKIIKVAQGAETPVDVVDMRIDDVLPLIRGKKGTEVRLTVRKPDGSIIIVPLVRDVIALEDSYAKSAIIEHKKTNQRVGLIDLRSFYADFQDMRGRRCARDVKAEVQKLIAEEVNGIVIDLRFNGGGSLSDVVDMTGLFIDKGPVVQVKSRDAEPMIMDDKDGSVLYGGPLVILVNSFSASASEIMAAALQDYGRAVIIGTTPTTFGKGTVQRFFSLDDGLNGNKAYQALGKLGDIKITIQKFYRINGGSTQNKGVIPDIVLPSQYTYLENGEKDEDFAMPWTEIKPATYKAKPTVGNLSKIKSNSQKRVAANKTFKLVDENAKWIKQEQDRSLHPLQLEKYQNERKAADAKSKQYKDLYEKDLEEMSIHTLIADATALKSDPNREEGMKTWHKQLKKDFYLEEALFVIKDLTK